jgi:peptide/nickel transport system permease protein
MVGYIVRRTISALLVLWVTSMIVFALFFFGPANPGQKLCQAQSSNCTAERVEALNESLGFNDSVVHQYALWFKGIFTGREIDFGASTIDCPAPCFGISYTTREPVFDLMKEGLPITVSLAVGGACIFFPLGLLLGSLAAQRRGTVTDKALVSSSLVISSIPYFLVALLAQIYLVIIWKVVPTPQYTPLLDNPWAWFTGLLLPWVVLGVTNSTSYARFSRGSMVDALGEDYVRTAKAKGLAPRVVTRKHALRAAIVPVVTIFGLDFATLLGGTIFTEYIFSLNGIGRLSIQAVHDQNFPIVATTVLFAASLVVFSNVAVDVLYTVIDPRVRLV